MSQNVGRNTRMERKGSQGEGLGLSLGNPGEERRLSATLLKIDREKRKRETAMSWNQRSFFIKQVFDQDNDLRFVKAAQRPKYLNCIPPPPRDGDNGWLKEEYVFSFKPKSSKSPESKDFLRGKHEEESSKAIDADEDGSVDQHQQEESKPDGEAVVAAAAKNNEQTEREKKEQEKRDLASRGIFGARRAKMKMPLLMSGAWKPKVEPDLENEEVIDKSPNDSKLAPEPEPEETKSTTEETAPLIQSKSSSGCTPEAVKPKTRFPVLKVRALGLFAMTFKKTPPVPHLQSQPSLQSQSSTDLKLSPISNPEKEALFLTASLPPQTAPNMTVIRSPPPTTSGALKIQRPGSVSLPNAPITDRRPHLVRHHSDHALLKSIERPKTGKRRGSRRDSTAKSIHEPSKRHESGGKSIQSASSTLPKSKRDGTAKTSLSFSLPKTDSSHIWGASSETESQEKDHKDNTSRGADKDEEEVGYQVIRRIVRTLPGHLMMKTSKREVEASGDVALLRQKMKDLARADTTRRASLDPRFRKLEKSLCNSP